jgi:hypothetical protein
MQTKQKIMTGSEYCQGVTGLLVALLFHIVILESTGFGIILTQREGPQAPVSKGFASSLMRVRWLQMANVQIAQQEFVPLSSVLVYF